MPELLARAGYSTVLVGRNMHQHAASGDCGYQRSILGSTYVRGDEYDKFLRRIAPGTGGIRQLIKNLGLTISHERGYTLSPRGRRVLRHLAEGAR